MALLDGGGATDAAQAAAQASSAAEGLSGVPSSFIQNPPFDARLGKRGAVDANGNFTTLGRELVQRGAIITDTTYTSSHGAYCLNFQFNPTSFEHTSALNQSIPAQLTPSYAGESMDWLTMSSNAGQAVSFNLLFDRTFETWQQDVNNPASMSGCLVDIKTLYTMLGMYHDLTQSADPSVDNTTAAGTATAFSTTVDPLQVFQLTPMSPMWAVPVWVIFGPLMSYYGLIQSLDVTFTHFTQQMIPVRATVGVAMQILPKSDASYANVALSNATTQRRSMVVGGSLDSPNANMTLPNPYGPAIGRLR